RLALGVHCHAAAVIVALVYCFFFFLMLPALPRSTLFPYTTLFRSSFRMQGVEFDNGDMYVDGHKAASDVRDEFVSVTEAALWPRSEERFSRNAETDLVWRLLLEKNNGGPRADGSRGSRRTILTASR